MILLVPVPAEAAGETFYASPEGGGGTCSQEAPCTIKDAVAKADDGDAVSLIRGAYQAPYGGLTIEKAIDFGGQPGNPVFIPTDVSGAIRVTGNSKPVLHDLRIKGPNGLSLGSGSADRVFVVGVGVNACELQIGSTLRDSICWTKGVIEETEEEVGEGEEPAASFSDALDITASGEGVSGLVVLRNVTAIADNGPGVALRVTGIYGAEVTVDAANVIARSAAGTDVVAFVGEVPGEAHLDIVNSNFGEFADAPQPATVTPLGTSGNISAPPTFVDAAKGNFHVGADSPTIDGGVLDAAVGAFDLDGGDRARGGCFGAALVPDMGAYERTATQSCPPPPPLPPPTIAPRRPVFRILKIKLNRRTGFGRVLVEVPGAGTVSLTGSGVKLVRRRAPGAGGVVSLPIRTWAITRVRLARGGKTRVRLRVIFEGRGGGLKQWGRSVLLRKKNKAPNRRKHGKRG